jgi:hypothetical protein
MRITFASVLPIVVTLGLLTACGDDSGSGGSASTGSTSTGKGGAGTSVTTGTTATTGQTTSTSATTTSTSASTSVATSSSTGGTLPFVCGTTMCDATTQYCREDEGFVVSYSCVSHAVCSGSSQVSCACLNVQLMSCNFCNDVGGGPILNCGHG